MNFYEIQRELYTRCANALKDEFDKVKVLNSMSTLPAEFPCVAIVFNNSPSVRNTRTNDGNEYRDFFINVDVYTNTQNKKLDAETISAFVQDHFCKYNFQVESDRPVNGINAPTIYHQSTTLVATVKNDGTIYYRG